MQGGTLAFVEKNKEAYTKEHQKKHHLACCLHELCVNFLHFGGFFLIYRIFKVHLGFVHFVVQSLEKIKLKRLLHTNCLPRLILIEQ